MVFVVLLWGFSFLVVKESLDHITPFWFLFLRFAVALLSLLLFFPRFWQGVGAYSLRSSLLVGLVLYAGFAFQTLGLQYTTPAKSAFITGSAVLMVPLLNWAAFGVAIRRPVGVGVLVAFVGLWLLTRPDDLAPLNQGDTLTLLCALAFALHIILVGRYAARIPSRQLAVLQIFWATLAALPLALLLETPGFVYPSSLYLSLFYLGVFCSAVAFLVQTRAQRYTSSARTALIFSLEPVFAAMASMALLGEQLNVSEWFGGMLIVAGVMVGEVGVLKSKGNGPATWSV